MFDPTQLLNSLLGGTQQQAGTPQQGGAAPAAGLGTGGLGGLLGSLLSQAQAAAGQASTTMAQAGGPAAIATQVFGQATSGLKDAAGKIEGATGIAAQAEEALKNATGGQGFNDLLGKAKEMMGQNQMATGAAIGGLASLILGTSTGRGVAFDTAKLGGLAMIGGLAYKAYQNFTSASLMPAAREATGEAPAASPFGSIGNAEADKQTSLTLIRAMIAAAASDGMIDNEERSNIVGGLSQAGLDVNAAKFLETEFRTPASIDALVAASSSPEMASQIYTAARLAIHGQKPAEMAFLQKLASGLHLDPNLVAHIEASAVSVKGH